MFQKKKKWIPSQVSERTIQVNAGGNQPSTKYQANISIIKGLQPIQRVFNCPDVKRKLLITASLGYYMIIFTNIKIQKFKSDLVDADKP